MHGGQQGCKTVSEYFRCNEELKEIGGNPQTIKQEGQGESGTPKHAE